MSRTALALVMALALALMLAGSADFGVQPVQGQTAATLVKNTGQTSGIVGNALDSTSSTRGQGFVTGSQAAGYRLSSIGIRFSTVIETAAADKITVTLREESTGGEPEAEVCTLTNPASITAQAVNDFEAPRDCGVLEAATTYYVVVERTDASGDFIALSFTSSPNEDTGAATGWSIQDSSDLYNIDDGWADVGGNVHLIEVYGESLAATLVKNTGQTIETNGNELDDNPTSIAQGFRTGSHSRGYKVSEFGIDFHTIADTATAGSELTVTLNADSSGDPGSVLCTLTDPASFSASGMHRFTAATSGVGACQTLAPETDYFVVIDRANNNTDTISLSFTRSLDEDTLSPATGWTVGDLRHRYQVSWQTNGGAHIIDVQGSECGEPPGPYAYDACEDFDTLIAAGNDVPYGIWSDGTTMWVVEDSDNKLYAYRMSDMTRDSAKDITLHSDNTVPRGIWSDGTTMWVMDSTDDKLYAYKMSDKMRDDGKDFNALADADNGSPNGIWSDGTTMWVSDPADIKLYAYNMSNKNHDSGKDFHTLFAAGNTYPTGIWSDGSTMWVVDSTDDKVYAYQMPQPTAYELSVTSATQDANGVPVMVEGSAGVTVTVTVTSGGPLASAETLTLEWDGTAVGGTDLPGGLLALPSGTTGVTIDAGSSSGSVTLTADDDEAYTPEFAAELTAILGTSVVDATELAWRDDEAGPEVTIAASPTTVTEGDDVDLTVTLNRAFRPVVGGTFSLEILIDNPKFMGSTLLVSLVPGETEVPRTVAVPDDPDQSDPYDVVYTLQAFPNSHYTLGDPSSATVQVLDDDTPPTAPQSLTASTAGSGAVRLTWNEPQNGGGGQPIRKYQYRHAQGSSVPAATGWTDVPDSVEGGANRTSYTVRNLTDDQLFAFEVRAVNGADLEGPAAMTSETPVAGVPVKFNVRSQSADEDGSVTVTVKLGEAPAAGTSVTIPIEASPGTGLEANEYSGVPQNVTFTAGETSVSFTVDFHGDGEDEPNEALVLSFGTPLPAGYASVAPFETILTLVDDDTPAPMVRHFRGVSGSQTAIPVIWFAERHAHEYKLEYRKGGTTDSWTRITRGDFDHLPSTSSNRLLAGIATGLECNTAYDFRISMRGDGEPYVNAFGPHAETSHRTGECARTDRPTNLLTTVTPECAILSWTAPTGGDYTGVRVRRLEPGEHNYTTIHESLNSAPTSYRDCRNSGDGYGDGDRPSYNYRITYIKSDGAGGATKSEYAQTGFGEYGPSEVPWVQPPRNVRLTRDTDSQRRMGWAAPPSLDTTIMAGLQGRSLPTRDPWITGYVVERREFRVRGDDDFYFPENEDWEVVREGNDGNTGTSYTDNEDANGRKFVYRIMTTNALGRSSGDYIFDWLWDSPHRDAVIDLAATDTTSDGSAENNGNTRGDETNNPATGAPTISGTAQVGETLTAGTSDISDSDGLTSVSYSYQWLADGADINGATGSTYQVSDDDVGKTIKVKVSFTDDANNEESLTSAATGQVTAAVAARPDPLTAALENNPASHDGSADFTFEVRFSEEFSVSHLTLRDHAFTVTGGTVEKAARADAPSNILWKITVQPGGNGDVTIVLPVTTDCNAQGAICTGDDRKLSNRLAVTVYGPGSAIQNSPATGAPTIGGTAQAGQTLGVSTSGITDSDGLTNVSYSYQWLADDADIEDATGSTYKVSDDDVGKTIKVRVSFTDDASNQESLTSAATAAVTAKTNTPATGLPTITGTAQVDEALTASTSWITDADGIDSVSFSYQWIAGGSNIPGATGSSYTLTASRQGQTIQVKVSFTDAADNEETLTSEATAAVAAKPNSPATGQPTISGTAQVGETLTADTSAIADEDGLENASFSYQWIRNEGSTDTDVSGATGQTYILGADDKGKTVKVQVSLTDDEGNSETLTSASTAAVVASPNSPATGIPTIGGTAQVGQTLTADTSGIADNDGLDNVSYNYQWTAGGSDIPGATGSSYTLTASEQGQTIQVQVSFTDDGGNDESLTSAATDAVAAKPDPLTVTLENNPASHDGQAVFTFELRFSEHIADLSYRTLRDHALTVTGGQVKKAERMDPDSETRNIHWKITVGPDGNGDVTIVLPVTTDCGAQRAICTEDGRKLSNRLELTVSGPDSAIQNSPATGAPAITGTAQVGQTLAASTTGIADSDGLTGVSYSYQWLADGADIEDATGSSHTLTASQQGKTVKVRVTFTDDANNNESLTSAATGEVTAAVAGAALPLTVTLENDPASHDGSAGFTFELRFSEHIADLSYKTLRDHAFTVTGGQVKKAQRMDPDSETRNIHWRITVEPDTSGDVTIVLPVTTDCAAQGAICTGDGRKLSNRMEIMVPGPGG